MKVFFMLLVVGLSLSACCQLNASSNGKSSSANIFTNILTLEF